MKKLKEQKIMKIFNFKNGDELTQFYLKNYVVLLTSVFEKYVRVLIKEFGINLFLF